jgi:hypothetical protein
MTRETYNRDWSCTECGECNALAKEVFLIDGEPFCSRKCAEIWRDCKDFPPHELEASAPIERIEL